MVTPVDENQDPLPESYRRRTTSSSEYKKSGVDDDTVIDGEGSQRNHSPHRLRNQNFLRIPTDGRADDARSTHSPSRAREEASRLEDDLTMLQAERQASTSEEENRKRGPSRSKTVKRVRSREDDDFDIVSTPSHEKPSIYRPPEKPNTSAGKIFKKIHESIFLVRYFFYITPLVLIILIPLLLGALLFKNASVGGVRLVWFCIWRSPVWLSLWAGRILAKSLPWPIGLVSSLFTNNSKKWRDLGKQLEIPATLFFWGLAMEISFLPTMKNHHVDGNNATRQWETIVNKIIISVFVCFILNFAFKIIIQLIAIRFHLRTYADRIDLNKFQIGSLVKLYQYSKEKISDPDEAFEEHPSGVGSGARTPAALVKEAQRNTVTAFKKIGDVTGKIAGDFAGKDVASSTHPHQVILNLLSTTEGSTALARRLYRTFCREETETVYASDLRNAFDNDEEADAAFGMFDKDLNGDISMEELEAVCCEIGRERKSITASLKDLDSVISKLDSVFLFIVFVITVLVFISLISTSAAGVLTSAGSTVLALSWLFSATAQEFLQSIIFVFVKHPFDVGDRVSIYGNTGSMMKGDDYFVKKISLLYTEFKKMEGHIVQAPNSYLNQLFILNQRRSGGLAEAVPVTFKFGTTLDQIETLRSRLLEFVTAEKREYQANILTELREVNEAHAITLNVVFFYKSNWQNELLRLQRRNKFICAMMVSMQELGIEGPRMRWLGQKESFPVYLQHVAQPNSQQIPANDTFPDAPTGPMEQPFVAPMPSNEGDNQSLLHAQGRKRGESLAQMGRRVDFSLGMSAVASQDLTGNVFEDRRSPNIPRSVHSPTRFDHSSSMGRSTSISRHIGGANLARVGTDSSLARQRSTHRNRFFGRGLRETHDDLELLESGMANIPEERRLDARSGLVSPAAWKSSMDEAKSAGTFQQLPAQHMLPRQADPERKRVELTDKVE